MSSPYLFDASSMVAGILGQDEADIEIDAFFDECWLDLTKYEVANAVWKIGLAQNELRDSEMDTAIELLNRLSYEMEVETATGSATMDIARETGLTFYDASYITVAKRDGLTLVSEDRAVRDAAADHGVPVDQLRTIA